MEEYFTADYACMISDINESYNCKAFIDDFYKEIRKEIKLGSHSAIVNLSNITSSQVSWLIDFFEKRKFVVARQSNSYGCTFFISWDNYGD